MDLNGGKAYKREMSYWWKFAPHPMTDEANQFFYGVSIWVFLKGKEVGLGYYEIKFKFKGSK